jgi:hypothetical protein
MANISNMSIEVCIVYTLVDVRHPCACVRVCVRVCVYAFGYTLCVYYTP